MIKLRKHTLPRITSTLLIFMLMLTAVPLAKAAEIDRYEFRTTAGAVLTASDKEVPIGASVTYTLYAVYDDSTEAQVDFSTTPVNLSYSNTTLFPTVSNPQRLNSGVAVQFTATDQGGPDDDIAGQSATVTVTVGGKTCSVNLTLGVSQIKGLSYYAKTSDGIYDYSSSGDELKKIMSQMQLGSNALEIPRGLTAKVFVVPVFTNATMYSTNNEAITFAVDTGITFIGGQWPAAITDPSDHSFVLSAAGDLRLDVGNRTVTKFETTASGYNIRGVDHDLMPGISSLSVNMPVQVAPSVVTAIAIEQWDGTSYNPIAYNGTNHYYPLTGRVGDVLKLRIKVQYSDGSSVDLIGANSYGTYAGGTYFLPQDTVDSYDPDNGYTKAPTASDFASGNTDELGVLHGYFMSHFPNSYSTLVNPVSGTPTASDWLNNETETNAHVILADLSEQIVLHQTGGTAGGISLNHLRSGSDEIIPGHYTVQLNAMGIYTLDFSGTYTANGYTDLKTVKALDKLTDNFKINLTVQSPTIEKVYLASDSDYLSYFPASDIYAFYDQVALAAQISADPTDDTPTFTVYPLLLDSGYLTTSDYISDGFPDYLQIGSAGSTGINKMLVADWNLATMNAGLSGGFSGLSIESIKDDGAGFICFEVQVLPDSVITDALPAEINLNLAGLQPTAAGAVKYTLPAPNPLPMKVYLSSDLPVIVTVNGSHAAAGTTGAGYYAPGMTATINAGTRIGYTFDGWTVNSGGVTLDDKSAETTTFILTTEDVTVTANWRYNGGGTQSTTKINGIDVNYSIDTNGVVTLKPTAAQLEKLLETIGDDGVLSISVSGISGMMSATIEIDLTKLIASDKLQVFVFNILGHEVRFPVGALESMRKLATTLRFGVAPGSIIFDLTDANGKAIDWYDYENPVTVSMPFTAPQDISTHQIVMVDEDGKIIPRSRYADGKAYAKVSKPGIYDAAIKSLGGFTDTQGKWMNEAVGYMAARGIVEGVGDNLFDAQGTITRAHFVTMLMRSLNLELDYEELMPPEDFDSVPDWAQKSVRMATALGLTLRDEDGNFNPDAPILRQEMFFTAYEAMKACGMLPSIYTQQWAVFDDWNDVEAKHVDAIQNLAKLRLVNGNGYGTLNPNGESTRSEGAQFLFNILKYDAK